MVELKETIDTWNMMQKYNVQDFQITFNHSIIISQADYNRMLEGAKNKQYIKNLKK
ncbi:MAG: hypothetical protein IAA73_07460 [Bacteroidetes bacterium]|uniref:Uncharacterized protein n=1 Tax=Candidatus Gallipaludibacter merdavium TaxID=2840839 RepID=A0A9D9HUF5_9BACT|nr:hypothetical protein [Candidatus Gallipaludibacter merdavium]